MQFEGAVAHKVCHWAAMSFCWLFIRAMIAASRSAVSWLSLQRCGVASARCGNEAMYCAHVEAAPKLRSLSNNNAMRAHHGASMYAAGAVKPCGGEDAKVVTSRTARRGRVATTLPAGKGRTAQRPRKSPDRPGCKSGHRMPRLEAQVSNALVGASVKGVHSCPAGADGCEDGANPAGFWALARGAQRRGRERRLTSTVLPSGLGSWR
jgi:hypothetical protein